MLRTLDRLVTVLGMDFWESDGSNDTDDTVDEDWEELDPISGNVRNRVDVLVDRLIEEKYGNYSPHFSTLTTIGFRPIDIVSYRILESFFQETNACDDMITEATRQNQAACIELMVSYISRIRYRQFIESGIRDSQEREETQFFLTLKLVEMGIRANAFQRLSERTTRLYKSLLFCRTSYRDEIYRDDDGNSKAIGYGDTNPYFISIVKQWLIDENVIQTLLGERDSLEGYNLRFSTTTLRYRAFLETALKHVTLSKHSEALWSLRLIDAGMLGPDGASVTQTAMDALNGFCAKPYNGMICRMSDNGRIHCIKQDSTEVDVEYDDAVDYITTTSGIPSLSQIHNAFCRRNGV